MITSEKLITLSLPRAFIIELLASIYALAFIFTPYWRMARLPEEMIAILALTIGIGAVWSYISGADLIIRFKQKNLIIFAILLVGLMVVNYSTLTSVIPWRGDEDFHIRKTIELAMIIPVHWAFGTLILFATYLYLVWHHSRWAVPVGALLLMEIISFYLFLNPLQKVDLLFLLRYPFVNYWFYAIAPRISMFITGPYNEVLYRIFPIISATAVTWIFQRSLSHTETPSNFLWGFSVATMPIVFYYSSILYIELPAVFLMTIVCFRIKSLLNEDFGILRKNPGWYALILIGFIKETAIIFLGCFLFCRFVVSLVHGRPRNLLRRQLETNSDWDLTKSFNFSLVKELGIIFSTLYPILLYLYLRNTMTTVRGFSPNFGNLLDFSVYRVIVQSFMEQFGPFIFFFIAGCILLIKNREYSTSFFYLLVMLVIPLFHSVDNRAYTGYSRFNLFLLPPVLAGTSIFLKQILIQKKSIGTVVSCAALLINILISPINSDGTKVPFWGNYFTDTSEHYYPYQKAISWLKDTYPRERILFSSMNYYYYFEFYFAKLGWYPANEVLESDVTQNETESLSNILTEAKKKNFNIVLYQVPGRDMTQPQYLDYILEKVFSNQAHILVVYHKVHR